MRILLIEDDEILRDILVQALSEQRYAVDTVEDGQLAWDYAHDGTYDLFIIDVGLPKIDGISLCQRLRAEGYSTPILLMTAKDAPEERIRGLDAGADDYLTKPLDLGELQARVRALLRRGEVSPASVLEMGALRLDPASCEVTHAGKLLKLTPKEYSLLELFLRNPSRVFSRGQIIEHLWTFDDPPLEDSVKAHIKGLRRKLKSAGAADWIENVYGIGYKLNPHAEQENAAHSAADESKDQAADQPTPSDTGKTSQAAPSVEQAFDQAMGALWEQYRGLMTDRLQLLQKAASDIQSHTLSEETRQAASKAAHKLAGVLGMFNRDQGTQLARDLESILSNEQSSRQAADVPGLVQQLEHILNLGTALPQPEEWPTATLEPRFLLISPDPHLGTELQKLTQTIELGWEQAATVQEGSAWLQTHVPELAVLDIDAPEQWQESLALLTELSARTPPIPSLVLTSTDALSDRVQVAAVGGQGLLKKPVTASQIWDVATQLLQRNRTESATVLAVDDDVVLLKALRSALQPWGMRVGTLDDPARFWEVLNATTPDLLILDVDMPEFNGIELCQAVRTDPDWQDLPIVFLTVHRDAETIQQIFAAGADDYVPKPIYQPELLTRITNRLERNRLLQTLASRDAKTGLANQSHSIRDLEQLIQQATIDQAPFSLVLLCLAELRQVNIRYGHLTGNQVLQRWGDILKSAFRGAERLGYWDNGEFMIGIPGLGQHEVSDRLAPVLNTLRKQIFTAPNGSRFQVSYHIGIAEYPTHGEHLQALYQAASSNLLQSIAAAPHLP